MTIILTIYNTLLFELPEFRSRMNLTIPFEQTIGIKTFTGLSLNFYIICMFIIDFQLSNLVKTWAMIDQQYVRFTHNVWIWVVSAQGRKNVKKSKPAIKPPMKLTPSSIIPHTRSRRQCIFCNMFSYSWWLMSTARDVWQSLHYDAMHWKEPANDNRPMAMWCAISCQPMNGPHNNFHTDTFGIVNWCILMEQI